MAILSIPLLFFPRFLRFLSNSEAQLTPLEQFLSNQLGVMLLVLATASIIAAPDGPSITPETSQASHPLLPPLTIGAGVSALIAWNTKGVGSLGTFVTLGNGLTAAWGFWTVDTS